MLETGLIIAAIGLRLIAGIQYFVATIKGKVQPNPITWLLWGLAPLVAFFAQLQDGVTGSALVTLVLALGPLFIFCAAVLKEKHKRWKITGFDIACGAFAALGILLWQITANPVVAIVFGIAADILGGIPTIIKSHAAPHTEHALPYLLSVASMALTLASIRDWQFTTYAFPAYILIINIILFGLIIRASPQRPTVPF